MLVVRPGRKSRPSGRTCRFFALTASRDHVRLFPSNSAVRQLIRNGSLESLICWRNYGRLPDRSQQRAADGCESSVSRALVGGQQGNRRRGGNPLAPAVNLHGEGSTRPSSTDAGSRRSMDPCMPPSLSSGPIRVAATVKADSSIENNNGLGSRLGIGLEDDPFQLATALAPSRRLF